MKIADIDISGNLYAKSTETLRLELAAFEAEMATAEKNTSRHAFLGHNIYQRRCHLAERDREPTFDFSAKGGLTGGRPRRYGVARPGRGDPHRAPQHDPQGFAPATYSKGSREGLGSEMRVGK